MMSRRSLWAVALLVPLVVPLAVPPLGAPAATAAPEESDKAKARRLVTEFRDLRKSPDWEKIKRRRDILVELGDVENDAIAPILLQAFVEDREQLCRIQAMIALGKRGSFGILKKMVFAARSERNDVFLMALPLALQHSKDERIGTYILERLLPVRKPETARAAAIECLGLLREAAARETIEKILDKGDRDARILYESLIALARIAGPEGERRIVPFLDHKDPTVRQGALDALGEIDSETATRKLVEALADGAPRMKEAAAAALALRDCQAAIEPLIGELKPENGLRVRNAMREALVALTKVDQGFEQDAWKAWLSRSKDPFAVQPAKEDAKTQSVPTYWSLPVFSDKVLFIIDISGSMDAGTPKRIETAREEIKKTLARLDRNTIFNVVAFASDPRPWQDREVAATKENIAKASEWIDKLSVGGGTNVYDTLESVLETNRLVDTIYFLGDGSPSVGKVEEQEEILVRVRWMNRYRKVRIHTIALLRGEVPRFGGRNSPGAQGRFRSVSGPRYYDEEEASRFLRELAKQHRGGFVEIKK